MEKRRLGKTGVEVSILGFGCMRLPQLDPADGSSINVPLATTMLRKAIDRGVNYIDTAYPYHRKGDFSQPGASEPFLARALADGYREKVHVATKLPTWFMEDRAQMNRILDQQLERLGTGRIDFYLAHNMNRQVWPKMRDIGIFPFLDEARRDGRIGHVGFSFHDHYEMFADIAGAYDWEFVQFQYNYLDTEFQAGRRGLELSLEKDLGVVVMEPLRGGFLVQHMPEEMRAYLAGIRPGRSLADWGLGWAWSQPGVGTVLSGMSDMDQVSQNLDSAEAFRPLDAGEEEALDAVRRHFLSRIEVNCTGCGYCLPCPFGVNIPRIFALYNDYHLVDSEANRNRSRLTYSFSVPENATAKHCVSCGTCETKCPQGLPIAREMPKAAAAFD